MKEEDICPVFDTLEFFNRKWILCILMDMFRWKTRFTEFKELNPNLSNYILSQTLKDMETKGLISKNVLNNRSEYALTSKGLNARDILYAMTVFSLEELECSKLSEKTKNNIFVKYKDAFKRWGLWEVILKTMKK